MRHLVLVIQCEWLLMMET